MLVGSRATKSHVAPAKRTACAGTVAIEVALACLVVLMLIFGVLDLARMHFSRSRLQYAVSQSTRFATVGGTLDDPNAPGTKMSRKDSIAYMIKKLSRLPNIGSGDIKITSLNAAGKTVDGPGAGGDVVTVQATYRLRLFAPYLVGMFPGGLYTFTCGTSFRNEQFR